MKKILFSLLIISCILFFSFSFFIYQGIYIGKSFDSEHISFSVMPGDTTLVIANNLEEDGVIKKDYFFLIYARLSNKGKELRPGEYLFSSGINIPQIVDEMIEGNDNRLTIVEGWNLRDIANYLEKEGFASQDDFYYLVGRPPLYKNEQLLAGTRRNFTPEKEFLKDLSEELTLEGYLFPDTYFISPGITAEDILKIVLENFENRVIKGMEEELKKSDMPLFEIITIASLIEKEVRDYEEKRIVSGIIQKRLDLGMRLQIDATVTYLTGKRSVEVLIKETNIDSPYNTYFYSGIPKAPICNPGTESIKAAIDPKESDYLYYLSKPTGETVFSSTFEEHVKAKNRYLK